MAPSLDEITKIFYPPGSGGHVKDMRGEILRINQNGANHLLHILNEIGPDSKVMIGGFEEKQTHWAQIRVDATLVRVLVSNNKDFYTAPDPWTHRYPDEE